MLKWLPVVGYDGLYEISEAGIVRSVKKGIELTPQLSWGGLYFVYWLYKRDGGKAFLSHRLVASVFLGPCPNGYQVNHKDGSKRNNHWKNLEYVTRQGNMDHAKATGLIVRHEDHPMAKLTEKKVSRIRSLIASGKRQRDIADSLGVSQALISMINTGKVWADSTELIRSRPKQ